LENELGWLNPYLSYKEEQKMENKLINLDFSGFENMEGVSSRIIELPGLGMATGIFADRCPSFPIAMVLGEYPKLEDIPDEMFVEDMSWGELGLDVAEDPDLMEIEEKDPMIPVLTKPVGELNPDLQPTAFKVSMALVDEKILGDLKYVNVKK